MSVTATISDGDSRLNSLLSDLMCLDRVKTEIPVIGLGYKYFTKLIAGLKVSLPRLWLHDIIILYKSCTTSKELSSFNQMNFLRWLYWDSWRYF